jgi:predicted deacylase
VLVYEAGQALRFEESAIRPGTDGVKRVLRELGMLPKLRRAKRVKRVKRVKSLLAHRTLWIRAPTGGVFHVECKLGAMVKKGEVLGMISDPFGIEETVVRAPSKGLVIGRLERPLVHRGDAVMHLAKLEPNTRKTR